jgi:nucleotide-binding universal stress UspA family protein
MKKKTRIAAAVGPALDEHENEILNHRILELASALARTNNGELHIIHCYGLIGETAVSAWRQLSPAVMRRMRLQIRADQTERLQKLVSQHALSDLKVHLHLAKGEIDKVVMRLNRRFHFEMVVVGTSRKKGLARLLAGSPAETLLKRSSAPVVAVPPVERRAA